MAKIKFDQVKDAKPEDSEPVTQPTEVTQPDQVTQPAQPEQTTTPAVPEKHELAQPGEDNGVVGDFGARDYVLPRLRLIQATSEMAGTVPVGSFCLGDDYLVLAEMGAPLILVPITMRKQLQEKVEWGSGLEQNVFDTVEQVRAAGGQMTDYNAPNYYEEIAHLNLFVGIDPAMAEGKDGPLVETMFLFDFLDKLWAPCVYTASGMSYKGVAKSIFTASRTRLEHIREGLFEMKSSSYRTRKGNNISKANARFQRQLTADEVATFTRAAELG